MKKCLVFVLIYLVIAASLTLAEEVFIYESSGKRDPFVPLVGVNIQTTGSLEDVLSIEDVKLQGLAVDSAGKRAAIMNGEMVKEGETVGRVTVKKILRNRVIILIGEDEYDLNIYEESK